MPAFEEEYMDVLQNIEFTIVSAYRANGELTDYDVDKILNGLWTEYRAEQQGKKPALVVTFNVNAGRLYDMTKKMCEWRLGRASLEVDGKQGGIKPEPISLDEIMACLKRIRKSVALWTKQGGRQGYLHFIDDNIGV